MNRVAEMVKARESYVVGFREIMSAHATNDNKMAFCFEGEDEKYYSVRISSYVEREWFGVRCYNKENVKKLKQVLEEHPLYSSMDCFFFVDKDFSEDFTDESRNIYVTPCYSVENLYVGVKPLEKILSAEFGLDEHVNPEVFRAAVQLFEDVYEKFNSAALRFNSWAKVDRWQDGKYGFNLKNVSVSDLVGLAGFSVSPAYDYSDPSTLFKDYDGGELNEEKLAEAEGVLADSPGWLFRGKQQLEFFVFFVNKLKQEANNGGGVVFKEKKKGSVKLNLGKSNALSELSQYAETPRCLKDFLRDVERKAGHQCSA